MNDTDTRKPWTPPEAFQMEAGSADEIPQPEGYATTPGDQARTPTGSPTRPTLYRGERRSSFASVTWARMGEGRIHGLPPRLDLVNHSPTGFEWGYAGSGPAQLAFALAMHVLDDVDRARAVYQQLKCRIVAPIDEPQWAYTGGYILEQIQAIEGGQP